jgi:hypothetical protein
LATLNTPVSKARDVQSKKKKKQGKKKLLIAPHIVSDSRGYQSFKLAKSRSNVKMEKYQKKRKSNVAFVLFGEIKAKF